LLVSETYGNKTLQAKKKKNTNAQLCLYIIQRIDIETSFFVCVTKGVKAIKIIQDQKTIKISYETLKRASTIHHLKSIKTSYGHRG